MNITVDVGEVYAQVATAEVQRLRDELERLKQQLPLPVPTEAMQQVVDWCVATGGAGEAAEEVAGWLQRLP